MDESEALAALASGVETTARRGFERLWELHRSRVRAQMTGFSLEDREDLTQEVFLRLWEFRSRFTDQGAAAFHGLLTTIRLSCVRDFLRRHLPDDECLWDDIPDDDLGPVATLLLRDHVEALFEAADFELLGVVDSVGPRTRCRQLLAAQLFYLEGESWDKVIRSLGAGPEDEPPLDRNLLDQWLGEPGLLRALAFHATHGSGVMLAAHLLGVAPATSAQLDLLMRQSLGRAEQGPLPPATSSWDEVAFVLWRFRHGMSLDQIARRHDCRLAPDQLAALDDRFTAAFPFSLMMLNVLKGLDRAPRLNARRLLADGARPGLWQRLAFEYRYRDELEHRDIQARSQPAAQVVDFEVTLGMLNVWLSNGRLLARVADRMRRRSEADVAG